MELEFSIVEVLRIASNYSVIVPLLFYIYKLRNAPRQNHIIGALLITAAISDMIGIQLYRYKLQTQILSNSYTILEFILLAMFFYEIVFRKRKAWMFYIGISIFIASLIIVTIFFQPFTEDQTWAWAIWGAVVLAFSAYYLYYQASLKDTRIFDSTLSSAQAFTAALILYFSLTVWLFVLYEYFIDINDLKIGAFIWAFHNFLNITKNLVFARGMYLTGRRIVNPDL